MTKLAKEGKEADFSKAEWFKSSLSGPLTDNCVEVAFAGDLIGVRDSKNREGGVLVFTKTEWKAFVEGVKLSEFDLKANKK